MGRRTAFLLMLGAALAAGSACTSAPPPSASELSRFLEHAGEMREQRSRAPFRLVWTIDRAQFDALKLSFDKIQVLPVTTAYLESTDQGRLPTPEEIHEIAAYTREAFIDELKNNQKSKLTLVDSPGPKTFILEIALLRLEPTNNKLNTGQNLAGLFVPGAILLSAAANLAGGAVTHEIAKGFIAIAMKVRNGENSQLLAEAYDQREDRAALLVNAQDFFRYGNAREHIRDWAREFVELMATPSSVKVTAPPSFGLILW
jgi:hypothetical protein